MATLDNPNGPEFEHSEYRKFMDRQLKEFAEFYQPQGPAQGHFSEMAKKLSYKISNDARMFWKDFFKEYQYPSIQRKGFTRYDPKDPHGN